LEPHTLGEHLRAARIDRKLTIVQTAAALGFAYQTVEKWEHNRVSIGPRGRAAIIEFIGRHPIANRSIPNTVS